MSDWSIYKAIGGEELHRLAKGMAELERRVFEAIERNIMATENPKIKLPLESAEALVEAGAVFKRTLDRAAALDAIKKMNSDAAAAGQNVSTFFLTIVGQADLDIDEEVRRVAVDIIVGLGLLTDLAADAEITLDQLAHDAEPRDPTRAEP